MFTRNSLALAQVSVFLIAFGLFQGTEAQSWYAEPTLEQFAARFGGSVAAGDGYVFVAEPSDFRNPGTVHVYERTDDGAWKHLTKLTGPDGKVGDSFGQAMAYNNGVLLVSDHLRSDGAVQVYSADSSGVWVNTTTLRGATSDARQGYGSAIAGEDGIFFVGAPGAVAGNGVVYIYRRDSDNRLHPAGILEGQDVNARFGSAIAVSQEVLAVGAPGTNSRAGAIHAYTLRSGNWIFDGTVAKDSTAGRTGFGQSIATGRGQIIAGLPRADTLRGSVEIIARNNDGSWEEVQTLDKPDGDEQSMFGNTLTMAGQELWVAAPRTDNAAGAVYRFGDDGRSWNLLGEIENDIVGSGDFFAAAMAATADFVVVGASGDDYGLGSAFVYEQSDDAWNRTAYLYQEVEPLDSITGGEIDCRDGQAGSFPCADVDLVSFVPLDAIEANRGVRLNDVWGWTDPETGKEYALVGHMEGTVFMDVSNPSHPVYLGTLMKTEGSRGNTWRDIKTYKNYAFIVADGSGSHGIQIFDLTRLRDIDNPPLDFEPTTNYDGVHSVHNIVINEETGFAYAVGSNSGGETCGGGLHMIDINDPVNPVFAGCFQDTTTGRNNSGATHDSQCVIYDGPDTEHAGKEICISSNGTAISIADVSDKENPTAISTGSYPNFAYVHQGWLTENQRYYFQNDEGDEIGGNVDRTRTMVWDLTDLDDPIMIKEFFGPTSATDHNLYVHGNYMYQTNNASGLRVFDVSDPENPVEVGYFDTTPYGEDVAGFNGTWSSYPFFESGNIIVTSRREGVFIVRKKERGT